jgi:hypothetical protein
MTYTKEQLDIELLKQKNDGFFQALTELKSDIREVRNYMIGIITLVIIPVALHYFKLV